MKPNPKCLSCNGTGEYWRGMPDGSANREECACLDEAVDVSKENSIDLSGEELALAEAMLAGEVENTLAETKEDIF